MAVTKYDSHEKPADDLIAALQVYRAMIPVRQTGFGSDAANDGQLKKVLLAWREFTRQVEATHGAKSLELSADQVPSGESKLDGLIAMGGYSRRA